MVLLITAALMLLPLIAGLYYGESVLNFIITIAATAALGGIFLLFKPKNRDIYAREGFAAVGLSWILMSLLGALPFVISGDIPHYVDALFETVSGFTTTGSSLLTDIEGMSRGCMFWRMFTHWIGGMGVLVFIMAVLPMSGEHSMHIMRAEVPGPVVGKLVPRVRKTAAILYLIYMGLTAIETLFLLGGGMSFFEALLHAFATAGTGGFSTRGASIAAFNSLYIEIVISVFMLLFAVNFNLYFLLLLGRVRDVLKNQELRCFACIVAFSMLSIAWNISGQYSGFAEALRYSSFTVASLVSSTGFGTADFTQWPQYSQWLLVIIMFIGACAGSTGGGLKLSRVMLLIRAAFADLRHMIWPRRVNRVQMEGQRVEAAGIRAVFSYFALYMLMLLLGTLLISFDGFDTATNFTAALTCLSNMGPGLGLIGPNGNFSIFSDFSKLLMSLLMLIGRLEIYPILVLFFPSVWRKS
mgnify:FL=1